MTHKKLTKQQLREKQILEDKKFRKILRIVMFSLITVAIFINIFYIHRCDTRYIIRKYVLYGKEISPNLVCVSDNNLKFHKSYKITHEEKEFFICSSKCHHRLTEHYNKVAMVADVYSGDTICKADALIGLKEKGKPEVVYFKNEQNFKKYYEKKSK